MSRSSNSTGAEERQLRNEDKNVYSGNCSSVRWRAHKQPRMHIYPYKSTCPYSGKFLSLPLLASRMPGIWLRTHRALPLRYALFQSAHKCKSRCKVPLDTYLSGPGRLSFRPRQTKSSSHAQPSSKIPGSNPRIPGTCCPILSDNIAERSLASRSASTRFRRRARSPGCLVPTRTSRWRRGAEHSAQ